MQIGDAAEASGVSAKQIRHYEAIGLVPPAGRRGNAYRDYGPADIRRLRFVRGARDLGFPFEQIRDLLRLAEDRGRSNADVKTIALGHVAELEERIGRLREMADALRDLADACDGSRRPDCPILKGLAGPDSPEAPVQAEP